MNKNYNIKKFILIILLVGTTVLTIKAEPIRLTEVTYNSLTNSLGIVGSQFVINFIEGSFIILCFMVVLAVGIIMFKVEKKSS